MKESQYYIETIKQRIDRMIEDGQFGTGPKITYGEIAEKIGMNKSSFSKLLNGRRELSADEAIDLAQFFNISCDELLRGRDAEYVQISDEYGLGQRAWEQLKAWQKERPEFNVILDMILGDEKMADILLRAILIYANAVQVKVVPLTANDPSQYIYVDCDTSEDMLNYLSSNYINRVLECFKREWEKRMEQDLKIRFNKRYAGTEIEKRIKGKKKQNVTMIDFIAEQAKVESELDELEKFYLLKKHLDEPQKGDENKTKG